MSVVQQNVLGLDVAVNDPFAMRVIESIRDFLGEHHRIIDGELSLAVEQTAKRFAFHERHYVVELTVSLARVEQRQYVRMLQRRRNPDFRQKSLGAEYCGELGMKNFDGDLPAVPDVFSQVHRGHSAASQLALDSVAIAKFGG
jgi:hypothetical protein